MCGICGFYGLEDVSTSATLLASMTQSLSHRGPDGVGGWLSTDHATGLGNTRLAIIDIQTGQQPMFSVDERYVIVFNGELYNFQFLRRELESLGHAFRTQSDTEVLLRAYIQWGESCLQRCRGMFAVAIYDSTARELFLARDRTGIKPLYYYQGTSGFYFGSELKAILRAPEVPRRVDYQALTDFLVLSYPLMPKTAFREIVELEPGTWLRVSAGGVTRGEYWSWQRQQVNSMGEDDALDRAEESIAASLKEHLESDVPIGAFLSGGIDSSLLVAILAKVLATNVETFTVGFREAEYDESAFAGMVAKHLGVRHRLIRLDACLADISLVDQLLDQFDQPFGDSSAIPTYLVCREMRNHVKVAIGGDGGDEMFGGYPRFRLADIVKRVGHLPSVCIAGSRQAARGLDRVLPDLSRKGCRFLGAVALQDERRLLNLSCYIFPDELRTILEPAALRRLGDYLPRLAVNGHKTSDPGGGEFVDATIKFALPGDYLRKVDTMSGAVGLEVRAPFLGAQVLDCAAQIPEHMNYSAKGSKLVLRKLAAKYLPKAVAEKPKAGFAIPLDSWLGPQGRAEIAALLTSPRARIRQLIRPEYLASLLSGFASQQWNRARQSRFNTYQRVYCLWSLERWLLRWNPAL